MFSGEVVFALPAQPVDATLFKLTGKWAGEASLLRGPTEFDLTRFETSPYFNDREKLVLRLV
jgi:hypothetical protein